MFKLISTLDGCWSPLFLDNLKSVFQSGWCCRWIVPSSYGSAEETELQCGCTSKFMTEIIKVWGLADLLLLITHG